MIITEIDEEDLSDGRNFGRQDETKLLLTYMDFLQNLEGGELCGFKKINDEKITFVMVFTSTMKEMKEMKIKCEIK